MIEVKNVVKTFDGFTALDGATITVPGGGGYATGSSRIRYLGRQDMASQKAACFCIPLLMRRIRAFSGRENTDLNFSSHRLHPRRLVRLSLRHHRGHDALLPGLLPGL